MRDVTFIRRLHLVGAEIYHNKSKVTPNKYNRKSKRVLPFQTRNEKK